VEKKRSDCLFVGDNMDNKKIKRIIAREGLILLSCIIAYFIVYYLMTFIYKLASPDVTDSTVLALSGLPAILILFPGYPIYLLVRFILWTVRTLRVK